MKSISKLFSEIFLLTIIIASMSFAFGSVATDETNLIKNNVYLTFDIEVYNDIAALDWLIETLGNYSIKATFFVLGLFAENYPNATLKIRDAGHEIGCHTYSHPDLTQLNKTEMVLEVSKATAVIKNITGVTCVSFRAPYYSVYDALLDDLISLGYMYDSSFIINQHVNGTPVTGIFNHSLDSKVIMEVPVYVYGNYLLDDYSLWYAANLTDGEALTTYKSAFDEAYNSSKPLVLSFHPRIIAQHKQVLLDFISYTYGKARFLTIKETSKPVALYLTFDVETVNDVNSTFWLLQHLNRFNAKTTFFVRGDFAEKNPELIMAIRDAGHEIGSHSYSHPNLRYLDGKQKLMELKKSKEILENLTGVRIISFRAPYYSTYDSLLDDLIKLNYTYDSSYLMNQVLNETKITGGFRYEKGLLGLREVPVSVHESFLLDDYSFFYKANLTDEEALMILKAEFDEAYAVGRDMVLGFKPRVIIRHEAVLVTFLSYVEGKADFSKVGESSLLESDG